MAGSATAAALRSDKATLGDKAARAPEEAQRASTSPTVRIMARAGLGARAVVYALLGYLTADIAVGHGQGKNASSQGALEQIARQPAGPALLVLLAIGFCAYGSWRVLQSAAGDRSEQAGADAAKRIGWAGIALVYLALAVRALLIDAGSTSSSNSTFSAAKMLLDVGGPGLLGVVAFGVVAGGLGLCVWAATHDLTRRLNRERLPRSLLGPVRAVEIFGNVVRGLAFAAVGASLLDAAVTSTASKTKGLNAALHMLATEPYGRALLAVVAAGFVAFAAASVVEALYRKVDQDQRAGN